MSIRKDLLEEAIRITTGDRNNQYGSPHQDFQRTAEIVMAMWKHKFKDGETIGPHEVALFLIAVKLSRLQWSPEKMDHYLDIAGYAACSHEAFMLSQEQHSAPSSSDGPSVV